MDLLNAILYDSEKEIPDSQSELNRRQRSLLTAFDSVMKGVKKDWSSPRGVLQSFVLHCLTQSELAVKVAAGAGHGAPRRAPQKNLYSAVAKELETSEVTIGDGTDVCMYFDNTQNAHKKTSSMRVDGAFQLGTLVAYTYLVPATGPWQFH